MVQITPLLFAITVLSQFTPSFSTLNGLAARQSINTGSLPPACQSPCQVLNTMNNCATDSSCICVSSVGTQLEQCMSCLVSANPAATDDANGALSGWNLACSGSLSLNGGSSSAGSSSGGPTSAGTTGASPSGSPTPLGTNNALGLKAGSTAVCIVAALAGAFIYL